MARRVRPIVAIDGPAGAGKSTIARRLAADLGFVLVDTGALYRVVALAVERAGKSWKDGTASGDIAHDLVSRRAIALDGSRVKLAGEDVSDAIRTAPMGMGASDVSAHPEVRAALLDLQRQAGEAGGVVLEGRDIGTVVFPDAEVKFFLTATPEVRAHRRWAELTAKGHDVTLAATLEDVRRRDAQDTGRAHAPLRQAPDALLLDDSAMTVEETVAQMVSHVRSWRASS